MICGSGVSEMIKKSDAFGQLLNFRLAGYPPINQPLGPELER
jgi:hypothetical protein